MEARMTDEGFEAMKARQLGKHSAGSLYLSGVGILLAEAERARGREDRLDGVLNRLVWAAEGYQEDRPGHCGGYQLDRAIEAAKAAIEESSTPQDPSDASGTGT